MEETTTNDKAIEKTTRNNPRRILIEVIILGGLYGIYTYVRNHNASSATRAFQNAKDVIKFEETLKIYIEQSIHQFFLKFDWIIIAANYYYGSLHFIVTIFALFYVFFKDPGRYSHVRTTIVTATLIALVGFITFPLMPPRLLPESYGFVDTLAQFPTFWSFNSKEFAAISNQYAAMPSVHITWASWCVFALYPYMKSTWSKVLLITYPILTFFVIIVTSNHYIIDGVAGLSIFFIAYWVSRLITSVTTRSAIDKTASLAEMSAS